MVLNFFYVIVALFIPVYSFVDLNKAFLIALFFEILVPDFFDFSIVGIPLSVRMLYPCLLIGIWVKKKRISLGPAYPFVFLYVVLFVLIFFEHTTPLSWQISHCLKRMAVIFAMPVVLWNLQDKNREFLYKVMKYVFGFIVIACVYGILQMLLNKIHLGNLYVDYLDFSDSYYVSSYIIDENRIFGRVQSTFGHPMTYGLFLCLSLIFGFVLLEKEIYSKKRIALLISVILLNVLFCGVRSVILSVFVVYIYYVVRRNNMKLMLKCLLLFSLVCMLIWQIGLREYVLSIFDFTGEETDVGGSSLLMRLVQLEGCFMEIGKNEWWGNGFDWCLYYQTLWGDHPVILAFESLLFVVICNWGYFGLLVWGFFFIYLSYVLPHGLSAYDRVFMECLVVVFVVYTILTGEYGYVPIFSVMYLLMYAYLFVDKKVTK